MKALIYTAPKTLHYTDSPNPIASDNEVVVKVESVGICGSDMHAYLGHDERRIAPLILGHEVAGTVVSGAYSNQRVVFNPLVTCGKCQFCLSNRDNLCSQRSIISIAPRQGAFAQYCTIVTENLIPIPDDISFDQAVLTEPIACGWHAATLVKKSLTQINNNHLALVIGAGAVGVGSALSLIAQGIGEVIVVEANELKRNYLLQNTNLKVLDPSALDLNNHFDIVIDAVGYAKTRSFALSAIKSGGVIVHIGLAENLGEIDIRKMTLQEITFVGSYTYTKEDFKQTTKAIFSHRLGDLNWIQTRQLSQGAFAFNDLLAGKVEVPKIVLKPFS